MTRSRRSRRSARAVRVRGQSHVVGVVLMLGLTAVALGGLTASVGSIVDEQTSQADAKRVASNLDDALRPVETTGPRRGRVSFTDGSLSVVPRTVRVLDGGGVVERVRADGLVYESGDRRVACVGGAVVRGRGAGSWLVRRPPVTSGSGVLLVGVPRLGGDRGRSVGGAGGVSTTLETNVSHSRRSLGRGRYRVAIETTTAAAFERYAAEQGWSTTVVDFDGDDVPSVVVEFPGERTAYVVVHDVRLEVGHG